MAFRFLGDAMVEMAERVLVEGRDVASVTDPASIGSAFGRRQRPFREVLGQGFVLEDPRQSLLGWSGRSFNLPFAFANLIWTLRGSSRVNEIGFYNERGAAFSEDGVFLPAAVGPRLVQSGRLRAAVQRLATDPSSRRAVGLLAESSDFEGRHRDVPCAIGVQYLVREDRLHAFTLMRSQSLLMVMPYDVFLFASLQQWVAAELGLELGEYHHMSTSMHVYLEELELARTLADYPPRTIRTAQLRTSEWGDVDEAEQALRAAVLSNRPQEVRAIDKELTLPVNDLLGEALAVILTSAALKLGLDDIAHRQAERVSPALGVELREYVSRWTSSAP